MEPQTDNIQLLLAQLAELNIKIWAEGHLLRINAPAGVLNASLKEMLRQHRGALLARLQKAALNKADADWPTIEPDIANRNEPFPLSDVQHAYWVGRSKGIEGGNVATHYYYELSCDDLDLARFNQALRLLIERHDMMRAVVDHDGLQQILKQVPPYEVPVSDLRGCPADEQEARLATLRAELSHQQLPAHQWPLFDIRAVRLSERNTRLFFSWDFINLDAWSLYSICREWNALYADLGTCLPPIQISYRDYVLAERGLRDSEAYQREREYWWNRLDSIPSAPMLPVQPVASGHQPVFTRRRHRMDKDKWGELKRRGQALGVTPSGILLAAFSEVMAYWSKQPHFSLNMTLFSRLPMHEDVNTLVGDFTCLTLLEVDLRQPASFKERAIAIQQQFLRDFQHRLVSGVEVLREWSKRKGCSMQAAMPVVFTSCLVLNSAEGDDAGLLESFGPMVYGISQTPQVWLDNQVMEDKDGLVFNWDALEEVFAPGVLDAMFDCYGAFLDALASADAPWEEFHPLTLPAGQREQRALVNHTRADIADELLHEGFVKQALADPEAIAVVASTRSITYGELLARSMALAAQLHERELAPSQLVAVAMRKGWEQIVSVLGILLAGGAYVPVDPELPKARRLQLFAQSGATFAVIAAGSAEALDLSNDICCLEIADAAPAARPMSAPPAIQKPEDLAYVIFTSGSTGVPKGVMIDHRGAVNTLLQVNRLFGVGRDDKVLAVSSLSFDLSVYDVFGLLAAGGAVVIPDAARSTDPEHWLDLIAEHDVTIWNSAPPLMSMLINYMEGFEQPANNSLRQMLLSGDWIPVTLKSKTDVLFPNAELISLGGATEASVWSIYYPITQVDSHWRSIPYGKPLPNQTMHVLNGQLKACPANVPGDIYIGGLGVAKGYLNDDEKTSKHFITVGSERLYYTGDLGRYMPDGNIEFLGREDSQVKLKGHRIELGEIAASLRSHPAVSEALVVVDGDSRTDQSLWAYLLLDPEHKSSVMVQESRGEEVREYSPAAIAKLVRDDEKIMPTTPLDQEGINLWSAFDELYFHAVAAFFRSSDVSPVGADYSPRELIANTGIAPRYQRWLNRALNHLVARGLMEKANDRYRFTAPLPVMDMAAQARDVERRLSKVLSLTERESKWFTFSAEILADILMERTHSAEIYTADETALIYQKLFADSHVHLRRALRGFVASRGEEKLRVLEVGAGLGSATTHLLPVLTGSCESYDFTDVSNYFLRKAKEKFGDDYNFVQYHLFDLDRPPAHQGYEAHAYDLIVASSVLHDVGDITRTLTNLRTLLVPGGLLLLLEETKFRPAFDLNMGLQQGFDVFTDEHLRQEQPLLSREQWWTAIEDAGFASAGTLNVVGSLADYVGFDVILAQAPACVEKLDEETLNDHVLAQLPAYMKPSGYQVLDALPVTSNGKVDYQALARPSRKRSRVTEIVKPKNQVEETLLSIWREVLGREELSTKSNFFEVGGDSLLLVEMRNKIKQQLGKHVATTKLFEFPTIRSLSEYLGDEGGESTDFADVHNRAGRQENAMSKRQALNMGAREDA